MSRLLIIALFACVAIALAGHSTPKKDDHRNNYNQLHKEGYFGGNRGDGKEYAHEKEYHGKEAHDYGSAKGKTAQRLNSKYREKEESVPKKLAEHERPIGVDQEGADTKVKDHLGKFVEAGKKVEGFAEKGLKYKTDTWGIGGYAQKAEKKFKGKTDTIGKVNAYGKSASSKVGELEIDQKGGYESKFKGKDEDSYEIPKTSKGPTSDEIGKEKSVRGEVDSLPVEILKGFQGTEEKKFQKPALPTYEKRLTELEKQFLGIAEEARERKEVSKAEKKEHESQKGHGSEKGKKSSKNGNYYQ